LDEDHPPAKRVDARPIVRAEKYRYAALIIRRYEEVLATLKESELRGMAARDFQLREWTWCEAPVAELLSAMQMKASRNIKDRFIMTHLRIWWSRHGDCGWWRRKHGIPLYRHEYHLQEEILGERSGDVMRGVAEVRIYWAAG